MSSIAISSSPIYHATGLLLLLCSFWSVYEAGYMDNDRIAAIYEKDPVLTTAYYDAPIVTPLWKPWLWALSLGAGGIYLLRRASGPTIRDLVLWTAALVATYLWFLVYNRANKASRVWLYPGLQFARAAAFVVLVPLVPIGAMALGVHIQARWAPYYIYRMRGKAWPGEVEFGIARLTAFVILSVLLGVSAGWSLVFTWTTAALIVWNLLKARMEFQSLFAKFGWLDRNP